jgi:hypothetical protein
MKNARLWVPAAVLACGIAVPASAAKRLLVDMRLVWKPTTEIDAGAPIPTGVRVRVTRFVDMRQDKEQVGENSQDADEGKLLPVSTRDDVAAFVSDRFSYVLSRYGVDAGAGPGDVTISGELRRFFVAESDLYKAEVALKLRLRDRSGKTLWESLVIGADRRWGRSYKAENYCEALSDAIINLVRKLVESPDFMAALSGHEK